MFAFHDDSTVSWARLSLMLVRAGNGQTSTPRSTELGSGSGSGSGAAVDTRLGGRPSFAWLPSLAPASNATAESIPSNAAVALALTRAGERAIFLIVVGSKISFFEFFDLINR